jgi:hypothetical protein
MMAHKQGIILLKARSLLTTQSGCDSTGHSPGDNSREYALSDDAVKLHGHTRESFYHW